MNTTSPVIGSAGSASHTPNLHLFDDLHRGDLAPDWIHAGVVGRWGLDPSAQVRLIVLSENITFRVDIDGAPALVVRVGRPGYAASLDHIRSELTWVEALRYDVGVTIPSPARGADGEHVQVLRDPDGAIWSAVAFEFVHGTILEDQHDFTDRFTEIGAVTARLHEHARSWTPPPGFDRFSWHLDDLVGSTARWGDWRNADLGPDDLDRLERAEARARQVLDESGVTAADRRHFGLIHGDLRPSNVMTDAAELTIIDFDDCGYGYFLYDFGAALTFYEHRPEARGMAARWLDGYRQVTPLSEADLAAAGALSMLRRLTMLGWATTHRSDALPADLWNENLPGTIDVAERFLDDPLWLVRG